MSVVGRIMTGLRAFKEAYMIAGMEGFDDASYTALYDFESPEARATRYDILWAYYQNNAYRTLHKWSQKMKVDYGLYPYIRGIYNPGNRICNFHQTHIWGGDLDREAGDGSEIPTALPLEGASDSLRGAVSQIWEWSRWDVTKDIMTLYGTVYGDVFLRVVAVPDRKMVYLDRVHPGWITAMYTSNLDEITYYEMEYMRLDPMKLNGQKVRYVERATLTGEGVVYQTFRENNPFAWDGNPEEWVVPYPFIPMVHIKHNDVGLDWGWSEMFPSLGKFRELDDQASKLSDQIRKLVDAPWMFAGVKPGKTGGTITIEGVGAKNPTGTEREISREETPILYAHDPAAKPHPLVAPLDLEGALAHVKELAFEIERSYPELRTAMWRGRGQGDVSGRALLIARQEAEDKVAQRRVNYDGKLVRAHQMAVSIAGDLGLDGFQGFGLESFDGDALEHRIKSRRPVFKPHPTELLDQERQLWTNAHLAERVGVGLEIFLQDKEWDAARINQILTSEQYIAHLAAIIAEAEAAKAEAEAAEEGTDDRGDISGRGAPSGGQDFDVNTIQSREG
jgi:hypothetical protein